MMVFQQFHWLILKLVLAVKVDRRVWKDAEGVLCQFSILNLIVGFPFLSVECIES